MIRHVALFRLKDDAPAGARQSLEEGLFLLAQTISQISAYTYGGDLGLRDGNFDFGVVADFEDAGEAFVENAAAVRTWLDERGEGGRARSVQR